MIEIEEPMELLEYFELKERCRWLSERVMPDRLRLNGTMDELLDYLNGLE